MAGLILILVSLTFAKHSHIDYTECPTCLLDHESTFCTGNEAADQACCLFSDHNCHKEKTCSNSFEIPLSVCPSDKHICGASIIYTPDSIDITLLPAMHTCTYDVVTSNHLIMLTMTGDVNAYFTSDQNNLVDKDGVCSPNLNSCTEVAHKRTWYV